MKIALGVPLRKKFKIEIIELQKKLQQLLQSKSKFLFCKKISHCSCIVLNCITWNAHFLHIHHRMFKTYLASYQWRKQEKLSRGQFLQSPLSSPPLPHLWREPMTTCSSWEMKNERIQTNASIMIYQIFLKGRTSRVDP